MKCTECLNYAIKRAQKDYGRNARLPVMERMKTLLPTIPDAVAQWNQYTQICLEHYVEMKTSRFFEPNFSEIQKP